MTTILRVVTRFPSGRILFPIMQFKVEDFQVGSPPNKGILNFLSF